VSTPEFDTVILAGGQAARMGGADKPALIVGNDPMVVSVARAATAAGTRQLIIVGPRREGAVLDALTAVAVSAPTVLRLVREEPPGAGPVAALRRGLAEVTAPWLALLAADLPFLRGGQLTELFGRARATDRAGALLADADCRPQWLAGGWQAGVLQAALRGYSGSSLHGLLAPLDPVLVQATDGATGLVPWLDCDTPADLTAARRSWQSLQS
jgi:molybdopterin-guanine dinucleotide biosynthesis protein A